MEMASGLPVGASSGPKTASGQISASSGALIGIFVSSSSSLTLKAWDGLTAAGTVLFDTTAAVTAPAYIPVNMAFSTGLYITIGGSGSFAAIYT
jgi:hypothetical protein